MNDNDTYEVEVRLWSVRDLDALQDALNKPWENTSLGLKTKTGFAKKSKCIISNDGRYICIRFEGKKDTSSKSLEPRIPSNVQADYMEAVKDLKQLIEQRKQE
jgi:hypothetical protein